MSVSAVKVLHLVEPGAPGGGACTMRLLAEPRERLRSVAQDVIIVGSPQHAEVARRCGVPVTGVLTPPVRQPALARRALARVIAAYEAANGGYDVVHAWTLGTASLASLAAPGHCRVATLSVGPVSGPATRLLCRVLRRRPMPLMVSSSAVEAEYRSMGVEATPLSVLPPAVNPDSVDSVDRETLRRRWRADEQTLVIGLLSEPVNWADARTAIAVITRVAATHRRVKLVLHPRAPRRVEAERWAARVGFADLVVSDDDVAEPWRIRHGLDAALLIGGDLNATDLSLAGAPFSWLTGGGCRLRPMPGIMPILWAMSAGVPVIAEASDAVRDVIDDGRTGLLVEQYDYNAACDRIVRIHDDPTIAGRIGMHARAFVNERHHVSAYCVRLREMYQRLVEGRPIDVVHESSELSIERARAEEEDGSCWRTEEARSVRPRVVV